MAKTAKLAGLLKTAQTEFRILNRKPGLTGTDKKKLKDHYLRHVFAPQAARLLQTSQANGREHKIEVSDRILRRRLLTAVDLERWLKIDRKTIWGYVQQGIIPYVRLQSNIRFREPEIRAWIKQNHFLPPSMRKNGRRHPRTSTRKTK